MVFLSRNLCQDPLENFFGCQRQRGRSNENPSVAEFYSNTQALRVVNSLCRPSIRANCHDQKTEPVTSSPPQKRKRARTL